MKAIVIHQAGDAQQLQIEVLMLKRLPSYLLILSQNGVMLSLLFLSYNFAHLLICCIFA